MDDHAAYLTGSVTLTAAEAGVAVIALQLYRRQYLEGGHADAVALIRDAEEAFHGQHPAGFPRNPWLEEATAALGV